MLFSTSSAYRILLLTGITCLLNSSGYTAVPAQRRTVPPIDTSDVSPAGEPINLKYPFSDVEPYPYRLPEDESKGIQLKNPSNIKSQVEYDPETNTYIITDKIGDMEYRPARQVTLDEYKTMRFRNSLRRYWAEKAGDKTAGSRSFMPSLNIGGEAFNRIFGNNTVSIEPQGSAELIFSINNNKIENPALQERLRSTTTFDFQEKIQMNVTGSIGDKVKLSITYDTEATFDFENKTNIGYTGEEDEIIQKIEAGNVALPLTGSLITGSQNLFGLKTELKFGRMTVTSVFSQQKGKTKTIEIEGGAEKKKFEVTIDDYDANRHFFLSYYFRNNYEQALSRLPRITSGIEITKLEVWVTNKNSVFDNSRNIIGLMELGETSDYSGRTVPSNKLNPFYNSIKDNTALRTGANIEGAMGNRESGTDYEYVENARLLSPTEYTFHPNLGYISLNFALNSDEVIAVAYEYKYNNKLYTVGELSSEVKSNETLILKLIKTKNMTPRLPNWDLMMKNVYYIGAYQMEAEDFILEVGYKDDETGTLLPYIPEGNSANQLLIQVLNLDRLNGALDASPDGVFDYVPGVTVLPNNGRIIFPVLEPFGEFLERKIGQANTEAVNKYVYHELYDSTKVKAQQTANKNKFLITGSYKSTSGSDISLNAMNIPKGSVKVTAGGIQLQENVDFTVDYTLGRLKILNQGLLESGTPIQVSLESNTLYNLQTKTLIGSHIDYKFNDNFVLGGTILNLTERPLTKKVNIGEEPISNTMWGLNGTYSTPSQFLTKMVDKLPLIETKEKSTVTIDGEFAHLIPGHSRAIEKEGNAYIDDFEGSETSIDVKSFPSWVLASVPQGQNDLFPEARSNSRAYGYNRAKLAWYVIDPLFLRNNSLTPDHIKDDPNSQSSHFVREIYEDEIWPNRENLPGVPTNIPVLNVAFYPNQRGPYNYDYLNVDGNGFLTRRDQRWGGIMREIPTSDFEAANVEAIDFWLMDPFIESMANTSGGYLYFNLGNVSEDILRDGRKMFENGLTSFDSDSNVIYTVWGRVPKSRSQVNAFDFNVEARKYQDVGFDGLDDAHEQKLFANFLDSLRLLHGEAAFNMALKDPSSDNFMYYRSSEYDESAAGILERYKKYNGNEGNSPASEQTTESYSTSGSTLPDVEDINRDNTLDRDEAYYQYRIELRPSTMKVGQEYITDKVEYTAEFPNGQNSKVSWYHFRIPIRDYEKVVGPIQDFTSVRFLRMFLRGFSDSVILRFASLDLVRSEWRKYNFPMVAAGEGLSVPEPTTGFFEIGAVNIEENSSKTPVNYVLPPGVDRVIDPSSPQIRQLNEQAILLKVINLNDGDARAAYKTMNFDFREYRRLKMNIHAEEITGCPLHDNELTAFIRLGSDFTNNFYEYEIPLKLTPPGSYNNDNENDRLKVWPEENLLDIELAEFARIKLERNRIMNKGGAGVTLSSVYSVNKEGRIISVCGNPNLRDITVIMIGIRNPKDASGAGSALCAEVWMNELRLTNFREKGGWAANARMAATLADFASVGVAGSTSQPGFGSIEKKTSERSKEQINQYDLSSNVHLGKFFPEKAAVRIPMYAGFSEMFVNPEYSPLDPDVSFKQALSELDNDSLRKARKKISREYTRRKSLNFTNVGIGKSEGTPKLYNPSNFSLDYGYNETYMTDINTEYDLQKQYTGGINYNYTTRPKEIVPFKKGFNKPALRLIKDFNFNYQPSMLAFRSSVDRQYNEKKVRYVSASTKPVYVFIPPTVDKEFFWYREYQFKYDLTRALKIDFNALNTARIDEPPGVVNKDSADYRHRMDSIWNGVRNGGRNTQYTHRITVSYNVPITKIPAFNWVNMNASYNADYKWDAGPYLENEFGEKELFGGNKLMNSNTKQLNANFGMTSLYNKVKVLQKINQNYRGGKRQAKGKPKKVTVEKTGINLKAQKFKMIKHGLNNDKVKVWVTTASGKEVEGEVKVINKNRIQFKSKKDVENATIKIEGETAEMPPLHILLMERMALLAMSTKNISVNYSEDKGTQLPGYLNKTRNMGLEGVYNAGSGKKILAPGVPFVIGIQDPEFHRYADNMRWLTEDSSFSEPVIYNYGDRINLRASVEPINGLRIELTGSRMFTRDKNITYYPLYLSDSALTTVNGNYSLSFLSFKTAWEKPGAENGYYSEAFNNLKYKYRQIVAQRYADEILSKRLSGYSPDIAPGDSGHVYPYGLGTTSPHILIPAFLAAYSDKNPNKINLNPMPSWRSMLPNWQVRYSNLTKIPVIAQFFKSVSLNHAYTSSYSIGSYINNLFPFEENLQGNYYLDYDFASVTISEQFRPIIGIDMGWKNNFTTRFELKKTRTLSLSFANSRLTEALNNETVVGVGYRFDKLPLTIRAGGNQKELEGDLTLNTDFSLRQDLTILRDLEGDTPDQPSTGKNILSVKFSSDYALSSRFNFRFFWDWVRNNPLISRSFPTRNTNVGFSIRFTLTP